MTEFSMRNPIEGFQDELCKSLEPGARSANEACILMSIAISLKRIADAFDSGYSMLDSIADRIGREP